MVQAYFNNVKKRKASSLALQDVRAGILRGYIKTIF